MKKPKEKTENIAPEKIENQQEEITNSIENNSENQPQETVEQEADKIAIDFEQITQKCAELNDKNLRLMAEFDNYRKRTLKERSELIKTAGESVLVNMLPLIDDFERALSVMKSAEDIVAVREGVELIYSKFVAFLMQNGVKAIPTENETFNTDLHEAVTTFPAPSEEMKGKIIDCVSKGYTMNEKVIRFAKVVVGE
jgi:molecular chaperone GrpE